MNTNQPELPTREQIEELFSAPATKRESIAATVRSAATIRPPRECADSPDEQIEDHPRSEMRSTLSDDDIAAAITIFDPRYPRLLREIYAPPLVLFVRGELPKPNQQLLAIVGARKANLRTASLIERISKGAAERSVVIISGLAYGIDAAAHRGALAAHDGVTVAVLGTPLDRIYPTAHRWMAEEIIAKGGALISTYPKGSQVYPSNFLERNRIIAGMSRAILVGQAGARSGSLATARFALEENREVLALPGDVLDEGFAGSNRLLREGATVVTNLEEVLSPYEGLIESPPATPSQQLPDWVARLPKDPVNFEHFSQLVPTGSSPHEAALELELAGVIAVLPGDQIQRLV
jgi:DNA processing protein